MMDRPHHEADRLGQYWNALIEGTRPMMEPADPSLVEAIDCFHAADDAPGPDPRFAGRLRAILLTAPPSTLVQEPAQERVATTDPLRPFLPTDPRPPQHRIWQLWAPLATAALLLLAFGSLLLLAGPLRLRPPALGAILPAVLNSSAVDGEVETTMLFDGRLGDLPDRARTVFLDEWRIAPGAATLTIAPYVEPYLVISIEGTFAILLDGVETPLAVNEARVLPPGQEVVIRSTSDREAVLLHVGITTRFGPTRFDPRFITLGTRFDKSGAPPPGPLRLAVERLELPPNRVLPPVALDENEWFILDQGTVGVTLDGERLPLYWDPGEERDFTAPSLFPAVAAGTRLTLRNAADAPLVLYHVRITADADAAAPPRASPNAAAPG